MICEKRVIEDIKQATIESSLYVMIRVHAKCVADMPVSRMAAIVRTILVHWAEAQRYVYIITI